MNAHPRISCNFTHSSHDDKSPLVIVFHHPVGWGGGGGLLISMSSFNHIRSLPPRAQMETRFVIGTVRLRVPISPTLLTCDSRSPRSGHDVFISPVPPPPPPPQLRKCNEAADYPASLGDAG